MKYFPFFFFIFIFFGLEETSIKVVFKIVKWLLVMSSDVSKLMYSEQHAVSFLEQWWIVNAFILISPLVTLSSTLGE